MTGTLALAVRTMSLPPVGFVTVPVPVSDQMFVALSKLPVQLTVPPVNDLEPPLLIVPPVPPSVDVAAV